MKMVLLALIAVAVGAVSLSLFNGGESDTSSAEGVKVRKATVRTGKIKRGKGKKTVKFEKVREKSQKREVGRKNIKRRKAAVWHNLFLEEERGLTAEMKKVLRFLRDVSDSDNKSEVIRMVQELQKSKDWPDSVPKVVRLAAIEALGWFGSSCLPEAVGFLADVDEEVVACAMSQFEEAVGDLEKSDSERAEILVLASMVVTDSDAMDSMLMELNNMRNSVAAETVKQLWLNGNMTTQKLLSEAIESVTGEEGIDTPEKLDAWLVENPDDEEDEEFYGGIKSNGK
ncbi:MAG: hypothetical protein IKJ45_13010 [Kiritimatiellae bacterium]|nr:hypothetical protein [Kiritimatiellia bacterium]MBR3924031.1 hypothetical protein [Kiritimatiellia bacterium]